MVSLLQQIHELTLSEIFVPPVPKTLGFHTSLDCCLHTVVPEAELEIFQQTYRQLKILWTTLTIPELANETLYFFI